ncbi:MAG TPA: S-methyl-5-thioribose-1-phosphate isomerase [Pantanalinema sp.]
MKTVQWNRGAVELIDQTRLPAQTAIVTCKTYQDVAHAITSMQVRGAPAIGVAAAMGIALAAQAAKAPDTTALLAAIQGAARELRATRPTAVNLGWALDRMLLAAEEKLHIGVNDLVNYLVLEAQVMAREDEAINQAIGQHGAELIHDGMNVLTHCSTGALATVDYGTALGVIRTAHEAGKQLHVWVDETRPRLQGARLNAWELSRLGIPFTLITDNMAAHFMQRGRVDLVITGADRIAANGDTANKIGTYGLAVLAHAHGIPFYIAAPTSTIDPSTATGEQIPIEDRDPREVTEIDGHRIAPEGVKVENPSFDVTPGSLIRGIITERGILRPPYQGAIARLMGVEAEA